MKTPWRHTQAAVIAATRPPGCLIQLQCGSGWMASINMLFRIPSSGRIGMAHSLPGPCLECPTPTPSFEDTHIAALNDEQSRRLNTHPDRHCVCFDLSSPAQAVPGAVIHRCRPARSVPHDHRWRATHDRMCAGRTGEQIVGAASGVFGDQVAYRTRGALRPKVDRAAMESAAERAMVRVRDWGCSG